MDPLCVKIFSHSCSPRLKYIADLVFNILLGIPYEISTDRRQLGKYPVINYSVEDISEAFRVYPSGLLHEEGVRKQEIEVIWWNKIPVFFVCEKPADLPFDIFSAIFYLVTRYEEYLPFKPDKHGRFPAASALAFNNGFLRLPVVNIWVRELAKLLELRFPDLVFRKNRLRSMVSFDADEPFKFYGKDLLRNIKAFLSDINNKKQDAVERYQTLSGKLKDPWDLFDYLADKALGADVEPIFFFPVGDRSQYDRWPFWQNDDYVNLVRRINAKAKTGLHPSYLSSDNINRLIREKERLEKLTGRKVDISRYHYIRLRFPTSYLNLSASGFREDYSMGFPDEPGFRAGIAEPFFFYDMKAERKTNLLIVPFQIMDATLITYKKMKPDEAFCIIEEIASGIRSTGGLFHSVWHNNILAEGDEAPQWRNIFEKILKYTEK